jgi:hypothetical protein
MRKDCRHLEIILYSIFPYMIISIISKGIISGGMCQKLVIREADVRLNASRPEQRRKKPSVLTGQSDSSRSNDNM